MSGKGFEIIGGNMVMQKIETRHKGKVTGEFKRFEDSWYWLSLVPDGLQQSDIGAIAAKLKELNDSVGAEQEKPKYVVGQRVWLNGNEIGTVVHEDRPPIGEGYIWVYSPTKGYASCYDPCNVKPLPNGQL